MKPSQYLKITLSCLLIFTTCSGCKKEDNDRINNGQGIGGVWSGVVTERNIDGSFNFTFRTLLIYENGVMRETMPRGGLLNFDAQDDINKTPGNWRQFTEVSSNEYDVTKAGTNFIEKATLRDANTLIYDGNTYKRIDEKENNRPFEGTYTTVANGVDIPVINGTRPLLQFATDGSFTDQGIMSVLDNDFTGIQQPPGEGTYQIDSYTITLQYTDGRTKQMSFVNFDGETLLMNNTTSLNKR